MSKQVVIRKIRLPAQGNIDDDIDFICRSFGYFSERDKQESAGKIFRILVKEACGESEGITSDELANELSLSRGAIVYHLNSFIDCGLIIKERNRYRLRSPSLQRSLEEIKEDMDRVMKKMFKIAMEIDKNLGNYYR